MRSILRITAALLLLPAASQAEEKSPPWLQANAYAIPEVHNIYQTGMGFSHWEDRMRAESKLR